MMTVAVPVLVISGTMGSGKTTVLGEASDLLTARRIVHAGIDLDTLAIGIGSEGSLSRLAYRNLAEVWRNYAAAGAARLLLAEAVEHRDELAQIRDAVPGAQIVVCRLTASLATMERRVARREPGLLREQYVARVAELDARLEETRVEDFVLVNDDDRRVTDVAAEMLTRARWIGPSSM